MSASDILTLALGAALGGFVNGLAGFGTALFALGFYLTIMPPKQAVAVVVVCSVVVGAQGLWVVRHAIFARPARLMRFLVPGLFGIPLGLWILSMIEPRGLKIFIAAMLIIYGGYFSLRRSLPTFDRPTPFADAVVGALGGVLGGAAALSGALPTIWCSMRPWPKAETRAVLQPFNFAVLLITAVMLALDGVYTRHTLTFVAVALPSAILAGQVGFAVFRVIPDLAFRRLLIVLCLVSGTILLLRELI
ncbi:sulfite exporter TauE/SafE family protein [Ovoidimarina sediminis]|uniref:sulfite exporter TauE/SafE family protein n=1 Tax=Ovoidimarina sediminis TaxID=3079856 RepID=UPI00291012EA|nr:sulfite exporter TauE/SafE family protein [Rhodophyticola sp. MJ-SS7]MDU8942108.1 sulfite exporter TauE/SafE family protein [Rhodophyticola sp. MJ-SS7]